MKKILLGLMFAAGVWGQITTVPGGGGGATLNSMQTFTNKTIDGVDAGSGTTRAGENKILPPAHNTDCTALTDGIERELCIQKSSSDLFVCKPSAGGCDTAAEWVRINNQAPVAWATAIAATCDATVAGKIVPVTGALVNFIECSNASGSYEWLIRTNNGGRWQIPLLSAWTKSNTPSPDTTVTQLNGAIYVSAPQQTETNGEMQVYHRSAPSSPYSITVWVTSLGGTGAVGGDHTGAGVGFRESSTGAFTRVGFDGNGNVVDFLATSQAWSDATTNTVSYAALSVLGFGSARDGRVHPSVDRGDTFYLCAANDGTTNRTASYSLTGGLTWTVFDTQAFNANLTPNQLSFHAHNDNAGTQEYFFRGFAIRSGSTTCGAF